MAQINASAFQINSAPVKVEGIRITGNIKTHPDIVLRELTFQADSSYEINHLLSELMPSSIWNLTNLNLFNQITIDTVMVDSGIVRLRIYLVEKWYLWPIPFVEFADRNFNEWYKFDFDPYRTNFGLYLFKYNLRGKNQTLKLSIVQGYNQEISAGFKAPWFLKNKNFGFEVLSRYRTSREVGYKTDQNELQFYRDLDQKLIRRFESLLRLNLRPGMNLWHKPYIAYKSTRVADTVVSWGLNPGYLGLGDLGIGQIQLNEVTAGYQVLHEKRNNAFFPTQGNFVQANVGYTYFNQWSGGYPFIDVEGAIYKAIPTTFTNRLSFGIYGGYRSAWSDNLPYSHLSSLGYERYIRGYEAYVMDGKKYALAKVELRLDLVKNGLFTWFYMPLKSYQVMPTQVYVNLFGDYGRVLNSYSDMGNNLVDAHLIGYGVGLNALFYYDKVFRFEYSFNKLGEHGLKLHFKRSI